MGAFKKPVIQYDMRSTQPKRELPPADYSDEVTTEQLDAARKEMGDPFEEWAVVGGPAW